MPIDSFIHVLILTEQNRVSNPSIYQPVNVFNEHLGVFSTIDTLDYTTITTAKEEYVWLVTLVFSNQHINSQILS